MKETRQKVLMVLSGELEVQALKNIECSDEVDELLAKGVFVAINEGWRSSLPARVKSLGGGEELERILASLREFREMAGGGEEGAILDRWIEIIERLLRKSPTHRRS